jgi:PiT family inorganic phosphate transporter
MGMRITQLRPVSGFSAETGAAIALFSSTALGAPVSTTHTVAGAVTGVGVANRGATVAWSVFGRLAIAWVLTMPAAAAVAAVTYVLTTAPPHPVSAVIMALALLTLVAALVVSLRRAPRAADVEPAAHELMPVPLRPGAGSVIDARGVPASREVLERGGSLDEAEAVARAQGRAWQPL